jgi:hypothetical protein
MTIEFRRVSSIILFVDDWVAVAHFWARMLGTGKVRRFPTGGFVDVGGVEILFSIPDERNPVGGSPAPYFEVGHFNRTRDELKAWGCIELHYPLLIANRQQITQFRDPFGTIFGIQGPLDGEPFWPEARAETDALKDRS